MKIITNQRGNVTVDIVIIVFIVCMLLALVLRVLPVFLQKQKLDTMASELATYASNAGYIGTNTTDRLRLLATKYHCSPTASWSTSGEVQLNDSFTLTLSLKTTLPLFNRSSGIPMTLTSTSVGTSEVYWK